MVPSEAAPLIIDAVVPARGGSKRLPGKNLVDLGGLPLIVHSIRFGLAHPLVRHVYVSTDSGDIASVARTHGAAVIDRPVALASDRATTSAVLHHALETIRPDREVDALATLQPTSPLRLATWLDDCAAALADPRFDSAITLSPAPAKVGTIDDGEFRPGYQLETRSQDLEHPVRENGVIYLSRSATIAAGSVFGNRIGAVVTDHLYATIDIDTEEDLAYAAVVMGSTP